MPKNDAKRIPKSDTHGVYERDNHICVYCTEFVVAGAHTSNKKAATVDHIVSFHDATKALGWTAKAANSTKNLVCACMDCNRRKGTKSIADFCREAGLNVDSVRAEIKRRLAIPVDRKAGLALYKQLRAERAAARAAKIGA